MRVAAPPASCLDDCNAATDDVTKLCCSCYCKADGSFDPTAFRTCRVDKGVGHCDVPPAQLAAPASPVTNDDQSQANEKLKALAPTRTPLLPNGPSYACSSLARLDATLHRCGDFLVYLKAAFPDDLKSMPAYEALIELKARDLIDHFLKTEIGDFVLAGAPNDPKFGDQPGVNGVADSDIGALDVWSAVTGSASVIVAIIDSGANISHEDLQPNIWTNPGETAGNGTDDDGNGFVDDVHGFDFIDGDADVSDPVNHGTGVAGVIGAVGNNGVGIAGVNWSVQLMPLKFTDSSGKGSLASALTAIDYAIAKGARVINASFVMDLGAGDPAKVQALQQAVQKAVDAGIVFVAAAGNKFGGTGTNIDSDNVFPAALPVEPMISVAAVDSSRALADFSNFGPSAVDIGAPGVSILSTAADGGYSGTKGTSIATPFVAGAAALILSHNSSLSPAKVKAAIVDNARASSNLSGKVASGGTLDLRAALASVGVAVSSSGASGGSSSSAPGSSSATSVASADKSASSSSGKSGGGCALIR